MVDKLGADLAAFVPIDGFHLSNPTLISWGRRDRKGAWDTFDADGYVHLLRRLRNQEEEIVHAPDFDRDVDESIGSALPIRPEVPLVVTEGNYLLCDWGGWAGADTWARTTDQDNAVLIAQGMPRADLVITMVGS